MSNFNTRSGRRISAFVTNDAENPTTYDIEGNPTSAELALLAGSAQTVIEEYDGCGKPVFVMPMFDFDA